MSPEPSGPASGPVPVRAGTCVGKAVVRAESLRKGSRAMMNEDESGVCKSPRPAPTSSASDLAMPAFAILGFCVRSID